MCRRRYYLLLLLGRASERANRAGETTKRKACPTGSGNREEKVCMYMAAIEWRGKKNEEEKERCQYVVEGIEMEDLLSFPSDQKQRKRKNEEEEEERKNENALRIWVRTSQPIMMMRCWWTALLLIIIFLAFLSSNSTADSERVRRRYRCCSLSSNHNSSNAN